MLSIILQGCGSGDSWDGYATNINGVPVVVNNSTPTLSDMPFALEEAIKFGGDTLYNGLPLNRAFSAVQDLTGNIYVSDIGNYRVLSFTDDGKYRKSYGTRGPGPGEFSAVGSIAVHDNSIYVQDTRRRTISSLSMKDGSVQTSIPVDVFGSWGVDDDGVIHVSDYIALSSSEAENMVSFYGDGTLANEFNSSYDRVMELNGVGAFPSVHVSKTRVYYAWPYPYRIEIMKRDFSPLLNLELVDSGLSEPSRPRVVDGMNIGGSLPAQISKILEVENTWILVEVRYSDIDKPRRVDVFDMNGKYLSSFQLESGEGISSYSSEAGMLWSTINGGMLQDMVPFIIGRKLARVE